MSIPATPSLTPDSKNPPSPDRYPVFVVEDDSATGRLVLDTLRAAGYRVQLFTTAEVVVEPVRLSVDPVLLVTDVRLPGMNGLELVNALGSVRSDFEVVVMTAHADVESLSRALELGIFRCLSKPFALSELKLAAAGAANRLFLRLDRRQQIEDLERKNRDLSTALAQLKDSESRRAFSERLASIGHFAASLAHEINNPLSYVQANLAVLQEAAPDLARTIEELMQGKSWSELDQDLAEGSARFAFELVSVLHESATGLSLIKQISSDLRNVARYRTDAEEVFDLNEVVQTACRVARIEARMKAQLTLDLCPERVSVRGSTGRLAQVVMNLVANAGEATDPQRANSITVRTRRAEQMVVLSVEDTGIGMTEAQAARIFEPFVTFRQEGVGLGLGLVKEIVTQCDGFIEVKTRPGEGSEFTVRLPMAHVASKAGDARASGRLPVQTDILIVEDDALVRRAYQRTFRGMKLRFAENGAIALREIIQKKPDLIVSDLLMPEMNGIELFEVVGARWPDLVKRMLFVTGTDALLDAARARAPGTVIVRKPFHARDLEQKMLELLA